MDGVQFYLAQRLGAFPQRLYPPGAAQLGHSGGQGDTGGGGEHKDVWVYRDSLMQGLVIKQDCFMTGVYCSICWHRKARDSLPGEEQSSCRDRPSWLHSPRLRLWTFFPKHSLFRDIFRGDRDASLPHEQRFCETFAWKWLFSFSPGDTGH